jgi:hypothetical protein
MRTLLLVPTVAAALFAFDAQAKLPLINATCPGKLEVHADQGGPVYVNGKEATLKTFNDNYYEAKDAATGTTISISINPDGSPSVSYTAKGRANGVCELSDSAAARSAATTAPAAAARESHPASEKACLAAVSKKTNVAGNKLSVIESLGSEAGISVSVKVPGAEAPWACMTDQKGKVWHVSYSGSEGKL